MSGGVFAISRGIFDHEIFADEPFTEREAWIWLIGEASWKDRRVRVGKVLVDVKRGQCAFSTRFMAAKWKWSEARVRRFLNRLKTDAMIDAHTDAHATRITICNYNEYQKVGTTSDAHASAPDDAAATHSGRKVETGETGNNTSSLRSDVPAPPEKPKRAIAHRLPADFQPNEMLIAKALSAGWSRAAIDYQLGRMRNWAEANGETRKDWNAQFRNWLDGAVEKARGNDPRTYAPAAAFPLPVATPSTELTPEHWQRRLAFARERRSWQAAWGPAPFTEGCIAPKELLRETDRDLARHVA